MNEPNEWDGSDEQLLSLQERFNAYVSFLLDGERRKRIRNLPVNQRESNCVARTCPTRERSNCSAHIHDQLAFQEIKLEVVIDESNDEPQWFCNEEPKEWTARMSNCFPYRSGSTLTFHSCSMAKWRKRIRNSPVNQRD